MKRVWDTSQQAFFSVQAAGRNELIELVEAERVATVIAKDMSRIGRDYLRVGFYTEVLFVEKGVRFIAIHSNIDSATGDNEFAPFMNIMAEWYARDTSKKIRAVMKNKGYNGEHLCTNPPYGYRKDADDKKRWIVGEEEAAVVGRIFVLCLDGYGLSQIARILEADKVLTPAAYWQENGVSCPAKPPENPYRWVSARCPTYWKNGNISVIR